MASEQTKDTAPSALENQAVAIAEQLGRIAGTIEGTAEQWMNRQAVAEQLARVRDSASQLIESLADGAAKGRKAATEGVQKASEGAQKLNEQVRDATNKAVSAASSAASALGSSARAMAPSAITASRAKRKKKSAGPTRTAKADMAHAPGKKHRKPTPKMHGVKKSDNRIPKMRTAETVRQRRKNYA